jgi:formyl-CoA transferase
VSLGDIADSPAGPLVGLRVVEFGHLVAGPLAGSLMADLGADVVHVERPGDGDPGRRIGPHRNGTGLWWKVGARNKRSVTIDLADTAGRALARRLAGAADVVVTNLRPTTLERWGLDYASLRRHNPVVVLLQISAFGATGPRRDEAGFGKIGEAWSGAPHLTGHPDGPPTFAGYLLSDAMAALMGVVAVEAALYRRARDPGFDGEWIDLALFEPLFRMIDWQIITHDQLGTVPARAGSDTPIASTALLDTLRAGDGEWLVVCCGTPAAVVRAAALLDVPDPDDRPGIRAALARWVGDRPAEVCLAVLATAGVSAGRIFTVADMLRDPVYAARQDVVQIADPDLGAVRMPAVLPHLRRSPGRVWRSAPGLGQDNEPVLREWLGLDDADVEGLTASPAMGGRPE